MRDRLNALRPDARARWGLMTCPQMICHLSDTLKMRLGEKPVVRVDNLFTRTIFKWLALYVPIPWPHGYPAPSELNQMSGGTPPQGFDRDLQELKDLFQRYTDEDPESTWNHPIFGTLSRADSLRYAYVHIDHHLRQFGV